MTVLRQLGPYYRPYLGILAAAMASMALLTAAGLLRPYLVKLLVDRVLLGREMGLLPALVAGVLGVAALRGVFNFAWRHLGDLFAENVVYDLRNALYAKLERLPFRFYDRAETGNLMARLTGDVEALRMFFSFGAIMLADFAFTVGFGLALMLAIDLRLTLAALAVMPLLAWVCLRFDRAARPAFAAVRRALADLTTRAQESISGVRTVKAFAREPYEVGRFLEQSRAYLARNLKASDLWARYFPLMELCGSAATALLLGYGGRLVVAGAISLGDLVAFFSLVGYLVWPIRELGYHLNVYEQAVAAAERLVEVLSEREEIADPPDPVPASGIRGHVRFERVSFRYEGAGGGGSRDGGAAAAGEPPFALVDIDLDAPPGSVIALLGPPGSGKSTLVSLIPRFYDVTSGRVTVDGVDVRRYRLRDLRRQVGFVMQDAYLFSATVRENIAYGRPDASLAEVIEAARRARAHEFIVELPRGYDTVVGERGIGLSGGQRQRIAIARALLCDPRILILDDATSSVDMETEYLIQEALRELMRGRTTFVIAHRLSTLTRADEIIVLDGGRIVERGRHEDLIRQDGYYRYAYEVQFRDRDLAAGGARGRRAGGGRALPGAAAAPPGAAGAGRGPGGGGAPCR